MAKMVKCKSCGAEIAKTANRCPKCGAKQHIGALVACVITVFVAIGAIVAVIGGSSGGSGLADADTVAFSGENFTAEYIKSYEQSGISGCFYVTVDISNTNDKECTYLLEDVYVDNSHCTSGSGLPVTALPGKSVKGVFIVFCDTKLSNVSQIEFCLSVMDSGTMAQIEKSQSISVSLIG